MTHQDNILNEKLVSSKLLTLSVEQLNPFNVKKCINATILRAYKAIVHNYDNHLTHVTRDGLREHNVRHCMASQNTIQQARSVLEFSRELKRLLAMRSEGKAIPVITPPGTNVKVNSILYHESELERRLSSEYIIQHKVDKRQETFGVAFLWMRNREIARLMGVDSNGSSYWCDGSKRQTRRTVVTRNSQEDEARLEHLLSSRKKLKASVQRQADVALAKVGFKKHSDGTLTITDAYGQNDKIITEEEANKIAAKGVSWIDDEELSELEDLITELQSGEKTMVKVVDLPPIAPFYPLSKDKKHARNSELDIKKLYSSERKLQPNEKKPLPKVVPWKYEAYQVAKVKARNERLRSMNERSSGSTNTTQTESDIIEGSVWSEARPSFHCYFTRYATKEKETSMDRLQTSVSWLGASSSHRNPKVDPQILLSELAKILAFNTPWEEEKEAELREERKRAKLPAYPYMTTTKPGANKEDDLRRNFEGRGKPKQQVDWNYNIFFHLNPLNPEITLFAPRMMRKVTYHLAPFRFSKQTHDRNASKPYFNNGLSYSTCDTHLIPALEEAIKIAIKTTTSAPPGAITERSFYSYPLPSSIKFGAGGVASTTSRLLTASRDSSAEGWTKYATKGPSGLINGCASIITLFSKYVHPGDIEAFMYANKFPESAVDHYMSVYKFKVYDVEEGTNLTTINWNERDFFAGILNAAKLNLSEHERKAALEQSNMNDDDKRDKMVERLLKSTFFTDHYSSSIRDISKLRNVEDIKRRLELYVPEKKSLIPEFLGKFNSIRSGQDMSASRRPERPSYRDQRSYIDADVKVSSKDEVSEEEDEEEISLEDATKELLIKYFFEGKLSKKQNEVLNELAELDDEDDLTFRLQAAFPKKKADMKKFFSEYRALRE